MNDTVTVTITTGGAASLELAYAEITADVVLSATTEATANTIVTAPTVTFDGATAVLIEFFSPRITDGGATDGGWQLFVYDGATSIGSIAFFQHGAASYIHAPVHARRRLTPAAGSHTYSIRGIKLGVNNATVQGGAGGSGALVPAFIRITKA